MKQRNCQRTHFLLGVITALAFICVFLVGLHIAQAERLEVKLECKYGRCKINNTPQNIDKLRIAVGQLRAKINNLRNNQRQVDGLANDVVGMDREIKLLGADLDELMRGLNETMLFTMGQDRALTGMRKELNVLRKILTQLQAQSHQTDHKLFDEIEKLQKDTKHSLYISPFGLWARTYGSLIGGLVNFDVPLMQNIDLEIRLGGGFDTDGEPGFLGSLGVEKEWRIEGHNLFVGGTLLVSFKRSNPLNYLTQSSVWLLGAGPMGTVHIWKGLHVWLNPFIGVTQGDYRVKKVYPPKWKATRCGNVLVEDWKVVYQKDYEGDTVFTGGVAGGVSYNIW